MENRIVLGEGRPDWYGDKSSLLILRKPYSNKSLPYSFPKERFPRGTIYRVVLEKVKVPGRKTKWERLRFSGRCTYCFGIYNKEASGVVEARLWAGEGPRGNWGERVALCRKCAEYLNGMWKYHNKE